MTIPRIIDIYLILENVNSFSQKYPENTLIAMDGKKVVDLSVVVTDETIQARKRTKNVGNTRVIIQSHEVINEQTPN